jgi:protein-S-isoprenylcysteine O-methyltransferase Ste14
MIAWINFAILLVAGLLFVYLYILSVGPAALEKKIGPSAYAVCARYRFISIVMMLVALGNYGVYYFYPLPVPLPRTFPWLWGVSAMIAVVLAIPSGYLMIHGMIDAGEEAMIPKKEHALYGGIYKIIRHPQAWEAVLWFVVAFLLHSPFLVLFSFVWLPLEYAMVMAEERDLIIRFGQVSKNYRKRTGAFWPRRKPVE